MSFSAGVRIGSYEIVGPLGAGGMGEVYRARDTRLNRDVAIKTLPDAFVGDPERVARLQREAQLLATVSHPHIAAIYGVEDLPTGMSAGRATRLLVLEFVDGETLAQRLSSGPLPVPQAIEIARQVAAALEEAHEKGIVHRDLKPGNVMLTSDDQIKVLDFGLARGGELAIADQANSPTATVGATHAGVILGTASYMSPEQVKGHIADKRSDVWAFGCLLYEMFTGQQAFRGESISDTLASVLRDDPDFSHLPSTLPPSLRTLLHRCLQKSRQARLRDMAVVRYALNEVAMGPDNGSPLVRAAKRSKQSPALVAAGFCAGAALAAGLAWTVLHREPGPAPSSIVRVKLDADLVSGLGQDGDRLVGLSADGRYVGYMGRSGASGAAQLMVRALDELEPTAIPGTIGLRSFVFSHDGQWIVFWSPDGAWRKVARMGTSPVELWRGDGVPRGSAWMPDGSVIVASSALTTGLVQIPANGGEPIVLTKPAESEGDHLYPAPLPGGRAMLFTVTRRGSPVCDLAVFDLASKTYKTIIKDGRQPTYVDPGYVVYVVDTGLRAVRFDAVRQDVVGTPVQVLDRVMTHPPPSSAAYSVSLGGTLAYVPGISATTAQRSLVWVDRFGKKEEDLGAPPRPYTHPRLSRDDARIAIVSRDFDRDLWLWDRARSNLTKLTSGSGAELNPVWLPDDEQILFTSIRPSRVGNIFKVRANGAGDETQLTSAKANVYPISISPDGERLVLVELPEGGLMRLGLLNLRRSPDIVPLLRGAFRIANGELSPDGKWLAYQSNETGTEEIYVRPFPDVDAGKIPISRNGGTKPLWCRNGRELFYIDLNGSLMTVPIESGSEFKIGTPSPVFDARRFYVDELGRTYDASRDGQRFLMLKDQGGTVPRLVLSFNWAEDLKRLLPAGR
jgi:eukaryotic-like serine/threonine-protein kinase